MSAVSRESTKSESEEALHCDFCGEEVLSVRRVALDEGYERLRTPHKEQFACASCSAQKDQERRGLDSSRR